MQTCQFPGCKKPAPLGGLHYSAFHRDQALVSQRNGTNAPVNPGGTDSSVQHRDSGPIPNFMSWFVLTPPDSRRKILFYNQGAPYYEFTNFSNHSIWYNRKEYGTAEHLFQSLKFTDAADSERIRWQRSPGEALALAQRMRGQVRKDWISGERNIKAMNKVLVLKFTQHENLRIKLLDTADALLVEDSPIDSFWGIGADGKGQNRLGLALMRVRETLRGLESQQDSTIR